MEVVPRAVKIYITRDGRRPFEEWYDSVKDRQARTLIRARLAQLEAGNLGDCRSVGEGVSELRIHFGPGYRIYFGQEGANLILLLCGGGKQTQFRDIPLAKGYWHDYRRRADAHKHSV